MVRKCTACQHKDVAEINRLFLCSGSYRDIARQFNLSKDALARHKENHIPESLLKADDVQEVAEANGSMDTLQQVRAKAFELLDMAINAADTKVYGAPSQYLREIREQVKLWAELEGRLATQPTVNILVNPEWIQLRTKIITALEDHLAAKEAVIRAIRE